MSICEDNINNVERIGTIPIFNQAFLMRNKDAVLSFSFSRDNPANSWHCRY